MIIQAEPQSDQLQNATEEGSWVPITLFKKS
jgi:hypothetical protein